MKSKFASVWVLGILLCLCIGLHAQTTLSRKEQDDLNEPYLKTLAVAQKLREDTVTAITGGIEKPSAAIDRLKSVESPSGLRTDHDADVGFALIDIGQRLLSARKAREAELFFLAAEQSLESVLARTADTEKNDKITYLKNLAFIRIHYLGRTTLARENLQAAIKLQPSDESLQRQLGELPAPAQTAGNKSK